MRHSYAEQGISLWSWLFTWTEWLYPKTTSPMCDHHGGSQFRVHQSSSWLGAKACAWFSICEHSLSLTRYSTSSSDPSLGSSVEHYLVDEDEDWHSARLDDVQTTSKDDDKILAKIPDYVMEYAPLVHLYSGEEYWPCDMTDHLHHTTPTLNYTSLERRYQHPTLETLDKLNHWDHGWNIYLTSNDNVEEKPDWLEGVKNIPATNITTSDMIDYDDWQHKPGKTPWQELKHLGANALDKIGADEINKYVQEASRRQPGRNADFPDRLRGGRSEAPAVLVVVDKGHGIVDAFWFFFYSFNLGNAVFNIRFGNHVGDWEHSAVRFHHGKPKAVYFSEHNFGSAYSYDAVEKLGKRPVIYSATGTHAMYATAGTHPYVLPWGVLKDQTDKGPLWDPTLNSHTYTYDVKDDIIRASNFTPDAPTGWFHYKGRWGDMGYPLDDKRQYRFAGQYHYVGGPLGPKFKRLGRKKICGGPDDKPCNIKHWLGGSSRIPRWQGTEEEADEVFQQHMGEATNPKMNNHRR